MPQLTYALCVTSWLVSASLVAAPVETREELVQNRHHMQVTAKDGSLLYHFTIIQRSSESRDETIVLVRDEGYGDFVMRRQWSFETQVVSYRISDLTDQAFVQQSYKMAFASKGREKTMAEAHENEVLSELPVVVRIETNGGQWEGVETDWNELAEMRRLRHDQRTTMSASLLEALERMRGTFFTSEMGHLFYRQVARFILYDADHEDIAVSGNVEVSAAQPHCDFDESFGFPCSDAQIARIAKAVKQGKNLHTY